MYVVWRYVRADVRCLYSSVAERQSCKLKVLGSIPSGGCCSRAILPARLDLRTGSCQPRSVGRPCVFLVARPSRLLASACQISNAAAVGGRMCGRGFFYAHGGSSMAGRRWRTPPSGEPWPWAFAVEHSLASCSPLFAPSNVGSASARLARPSLFPCGRRKVGLRCCPSAGRVSSIPTRGHREPRVSWCSERPAKRDGRAGWAGRGWASGRGSADFGRRRQGAISPHSPANSKRMTHP